MMKELERFLLVLTENVDRNARQVLGEGNLKTHKASIIPLDRIPELLGGAEKLVVNVYMRILGEFTGSILLIFSKESALSLLEFIDKGKGRVITVKEISEIESISRTLAGAYLDTIASLMKKRIFLSPPASSFDMANSVVDYVMINFAQETDKVFCIENEIECNEFKINFFTFLVHDSRSLDMIKEAMGQAI